MNYITALAQSDISSVLNNGFSLAEKGSWSLKMTLMGLGTVFCVLFIIWLIVTIFRVVLGLFTTKKESKPIDIDMMEESSKITTVKKPEMTVERTPENDGDSVLAAVITAAISSYIKNENNDGNLLPFHVVSFKKKESSKPWNGHFNNK